MQKKTIPKLANFKHLNPKIAPLGEDRVVIPMQTRTWKAAKRIALINNYGAGGSNAAMIIQEPAPKALALPPRIHTQLSHFPIYISGKSPEAVRSYCERLRESLSTTESLGDISYNLATKQSREFENSIVFASANIQDLSNQLEQAASGAIDLQGSPSYKPSVVLCFGGQNGKTTHISKDLYDNCVLLQYHIVSKNLSTSLLLFIYHM